MIDAESRRAHRDQADDELDLVWAESLALVRSALHTMVLTVLMAVLIPVGLTWARSPDDDTTLSGLPWTTMWRQPDLPSVALAGFGVGLSVTLFIATTLARPSLDDLTRHRRAVTLVVEWLTSLVALSTATASWSLVLGGVLGSGADRGLVPVGLLLVVMASTVGSLGGPSRESLVMSVARRRRQLHRLGELRPPIEADVGLAPTWSRATLAMWVTYPWRLATFVSVCTLAPLVVALPLLESRGLAALSIVAPLVALWIVYAGWRAGVGRASRARSGWRWGWIDHVMGLLLVGVLAGIVGVSLALVFEDLSVVVFTILLGLAGPPVWWRVLRRATDAQRFVGRAFDREVGMLQRWLLHLDQLLETRTSRVMTHPGSSVAGT